MTVRVDQSLSTSDSGSWTKGPKSTSCFQIQALQVLWHSHNHIQHGWNPNSMALFWGANAAKADCLHSGSRDLSYVPPSCCNHFAWQTPLRRKVFCESQPLKTTFVLIALQVMAPKRVQKPSQAVHCREDRLQNLLLTVVRESRLPHLVRRRKLQACGELVMVRSNFFDV